MCIICVQFEKGKLNQFEAHNALLEFVLSGNIDSVHTVEVWDLITDPNKEEVSDESSKA